MTTFPEGRVPEGSGELEASAGPAGVHLAQAGKGEEAEEDQEILQPSSELHHRFRYIVFKNQLQDSFPSVAAEHFSLPK